MPDPNLDRWYERLAGLFAVVGDWLFSPRSNFVGVWLIPLLAIVMFLACLAVLVYAGEPARQPRTRTYPVTITRVTDGDTVFGAIQLGLRVGMDSSIRLADIDCPELSTAEGKAARDFTVAWLNRETGETLVTREGREFDKYGRVLGRIVSDDGSDLAADLRAAGFVKP